MPRTCINGKVFVACNARWGNVTKRGYEITPRGNWIDEDDADEIVEEVDEVYCFRLRQTISRNLVFYVTPNLAQSMEVKNE